MNGKFGRVASASLLVLMHLAMVTSCGGSSGASSIDPPAAGESVTSTVPVAGGKLVLRNVGAVNFPSDAFGVNRAVNLFTSLDAQLGNLWDSSSALFAPAPRAQYEIRVSIGTGGAPLKAATLGLVIPAALGAPADVGIFQLITEGNDIEQIQRFLPVSGTVKGDGVVELTLDPQDFFPNLSSNGDSEAVIILTNAAPKPVSAKLSALHARGAAVSASGAGCPDGIKKFGPPLKSLTRVRGFDLSIKTTIKGETKYGHPGTDFVAADGTELISPAAGTVVSAIDSNGIGMIPGPDGELVSGDHGGAGGSVVIQIPGSGNVQFMHMKKGSITVKPGDQVAAGQVIGLSDTSGFVTGPHLHFEFLPENSRTRIDPELCIDTFKKALYYEGNFSAYFEQTNVTYFSQAASGQFRFTFDFEFPAAPGFNIPRTYVYRLETITPRMESYATDNGACSVQSLGDNNSQGQLFVYPDTNEYRIVLDLRVMATGRCPTSDVINFPNGVGYDSTFFSNEEAFARVCDPNPNATGADNPLTDPNSLLFKVGTSGNLSDVMRNSCTRSGNVMIKANGDWTLQPVYGP